MKKFPQLFIGTICALTLAFTSCQNDANPEIQQKSEEAIIFNDISEREAVTDQAVINLIRSLDIDAGAITKGKFEFPDGTSEERVFVGNDITFTQRELQNLQSLPEQYRTSNLVTGSNRTINIIGYTGNNANGLSSKAQTALQWSVDNYNALNTTLQFNLTFGTDYQSKDMVIYDTSSSNAGNSGGVAGFPTSAGNPHKFVQIYNLESFSTNVNEHVITHEIGHSVGFRHSDWFDRLSCPASSQGNEGTGSDGAIHIPGTPTGRDLSSVMQACFSTSEDGEFNNNDKTALEYMYPTSTSTNPCDGVSEWQSGNNYSAGDRVTYFGNLYQYNGSSWTFIQACS